MTAVLVTGGANLVGAHIARLLHAHGRKVIVLDDLSRGLRGWLPDDVFVEGCVGDVALVKRIIAAHEITSVVHFPPDLEKTRTFFHTAHEAGVDAFVLSRKATSAPPLVDAACTLRCFDDRDFLPTVVDAAYGFGPAVVIPGTDHETPDGTRVRDYLHVDDLAAAHLAALEAVECGESPGELEIGSGRGHSDRDMTELVGAVLRQVVPHVFGARRPGAPARLVADPRRALSALGWRVRRQSITLLIQDVVREHLRRPVAESPAAELDDWDEVDEASWESFPASDPPAHP